MGHAYEQGPIHKEADQAGMINRTMDIMEKFCGKRPVGWLGPGLTQTLDTPDLLAASGVKYIGDWVYDDDGELTVLSTTDGTRATLAWAGPAVSSVATADVTGDGRLDVILRTFESVYAFGAITRACKDGKATRAEVRAQIARTNIPAPLSILGFRIVFQKNGELRFGGFGVFQIQSDGSYKRVG